MSTSQRWITVILEANQEDRDFIKRALTNSGISFTQEPESPTTPLKFYVPQYVPALLTLIQALDYKPEGVTGEIILQDGRRFKIDETGKKQLLELTATVMNQQPVAQPQPVVWWAEFIPEMKLILKQVADLVKWYPKAVGKAEEKITKYFVALITLIVVGTIFLTALGVLSGDVFAFLIGTLIGYIFAFITKYLGMSGGNE